jgi:hypothetical protein
MDNRKYIGMDVHQASTSIAVSDAAGKVLMECIIETKAATVLEFIQGLRGSLWVTPLQTWRRFMAAIVYRRTRAVNRSFPGTGMVNMLWLTRVMNRLKAIYRSWSIPCAGQQVYSPRHRAVWLEKLREAGVRRRAEQSYQQLDFLMGIRAKRSFGVSSPMVRTGQRA